MFFKYSREDSLSTNHTLTLSAWRARARARKRARVQRTIKIVEYRLKQTKREQQNGSYPITPGTRA